METTVTNMKDCLKSVNCSHCKADPRYNFRDH